MLRKRKIKHGGQDAPPVLKAQGPSPAPATAAPDDRRKTAAGQKRNRLLALLAAAVLLTGLAACQVRPVPGNGEGESAGAPEAAETPAAAGPADTPIPPLPASLPPAETPAPAAPAPTAEPTAVPAESPPPEPETRGNLLIRDGLAYLTDGSGGVITHEAGMVDWDGYTFYFREDGTVAVDETVTIEGSEYRFDDRGRWVSHLRAAVEATALAEKTDQLVLTVDHRLTFWEKAEDGSWRLRMDTYCGYGGNGLVEADSRVMGTRTTPIGAFPLTLAFGLGPDPGTGMTYRQITETSYWSAEDDDTYNTWVESETPLSGEHLIDYYQYKYAVNIGFNLDPPHHDRGCAIFLHVKSRDTWNTAGCVSLAEEDMLTLLLALRDGAYMIIVPDIGSISAY